MPITVRRAGLPAALCLLAVLSTALAPALARADTVTDWNDIASTAIVGGAGQPPPVAVLSFAMVQGAVYDAVNAIDRGHRPYLVEPAARPTDSKDAAAATAAFRVLDGLFSRPACSAPSAVRSLARRHRRRTPRREGGRNRRRRTGRGRDARRPRRRRPGRPGQPRDYGTTPGVYRPTPPLFGPDPAPVGRQRPAVPRAQRRDCSAPARRTPLKSRAYARDFNEIKSVGALNSTTRSADQTDAAIFWQDHAFALWNRAFRTIATERGLPIADSARLLAMDEPRRGRRGDRLLEQQVPLELLAPDHRHPRGRRATGTR